MLKTEKKSDRSKIIIKELREKIYFYENLSHFYIFKYIALVKKI